MTAPALELADIFRVHGPAFLTTFVDSLTTQQKKALRDISLCRTAALGGHVEQCDECGHRTISYCSCRNRHCPKCGSAIIRTSIALSLGAESLTTIRVGLGAAGSSFSL